MDDQDNKKGYDDFFRKADQGQGAAESNVNGADSQNDQLTESDEQSAKPSYYYSYGPNKVSSQPENTSSNPMNTYDQSKIIQDEPYGTPITPASTSGSYIQPEQMSVQQQEQQQSNSSQPPQLRAFAPSQPSGKGPWQVKEQRRTSFKAIFASFLTGVIVVGLLMYTADAGNWFTGEQALTTQASTGNNKEKSEGSSGSSTVSPASTVAARPDNISSLFETASPAVVKIETYVNSVSNNGRGGSSLLDDPFFRQFFGEDNPSAREPKEEQEGNLDKMQQTGIGTGFFFESSGYILTNQHVIGESDLINVTVQGYDEPFTAKQLGSSYELDLAVLKIVGEKQFPTLPLGNSDDINIGDWVVAIGNPYGFDHTVTVGVLSAKERPIDIQDSAGERNYKHLLQTDASINPGNSGGPLLNVNGEVIGINTAVSSQAQGIGFAIPTSTIQEVLEDLKTNKEIPKEPIPFIGAELQDINEDIAKQLNMTTVEGTIVRNVYYNSPAYLGDLKQFDVILGISGKKYNTTKELIAAIQKEKVGNKIELNIVRKGSKMNLEVTIGDKNTFSTQ